MHDPVTQAFDIKNPFVWVKKGHYRPSLLTIGHHDPDRGGDDDSCGWFIRAHHMDKGVLGKIRKDFAFEYSYWFDKESGVPILSPIAITLLMFQRAAWTIMIFEAGDKIPKGDPLKKFMRKNLYDIIQFAENPHDGMRHWLANKYDQTPEQRIEDFVNIIAPFIQRLRRPWYKHPRWHIYHWRLKFHPLQNLKRRYWDKCDVCGKRGFKGPAYGDWSGTRRWHGHCAESSPTKNA